MSESQVFEITVNDMEKRIIDIIREQWRTFHAKKTASKGEEQHSKIEIVLTDRNDGVRRMTLHSQDTVYLQSK